VTEEAVTDIESDEAYLTVVDDENETESDETYLTVPDDHTELIPPMPLPVLPEQDELPEEPEEIESETEATFELEELTNDTQIDSPVERPASPMPEHLEGWTNTLRVKQDSIAIAKNTARCTQYMGALKSFESPHYAPGYCSRNF